MGVNMLEHLVATWRAGVRSNSLRAILAIAILLFFCAYLASTLSGRHPQTVALDVGISVTRLISVILVLFWTQELLGREVDRRSVYFALSYPLPRSAYLLGRYWGVVSLVAVAVFAQGIALYGVVLLSGDGYQQAFKVSFNAGLVLVLALIVLDAMVIAAFVFLLTSIATSSLLPFLLGAAYAFAARSLGGVIAFLGDAQGEGADLAPEFTPILKGIGFLIPDLSVLDIRQVVLYDKSLVISDCLVNVTYVSSYLAILLMMAVFLFSRRDFG
jgi:Cu-processing system permease protein